MGKRLSWTHYLRALGPGVITGASDNDPAGIATYSVAGASTGYGFLWLSLLTYPLMVAVQDMAARIGAVRGEGLGQVIGRTFGRKWFGVALFVLIISNVATIGADLAGVSAGLRLLTDIPSHWFIIPVAALILLVEVFWSYRIFARYMRYLTLILFAYVLAGLLSGPNWRDVAIGTFVPHIAWTKQSLTVMVAVLGTTISPYLFFWQASEEIEEIREEDKHPPADGEESAKSERWRLVDTAVGMFYTSVIFYFIILTSAATLHVEGVMVTTADEAARALRPIAGEYAFLLFSAGIIGAGLIAVPVLAGSTAYPVAEWMGCPEGLDMSVRRAKCFYTVLAGSVLVGMLIALTPINPIDALVYSQVLMGLLTPVLLVMVMLIARNRDIMGGQNVNSRFFNVFGWIAVALMSLADVALIWTFVA